MSGIVRSLKLSSTGMFGFFGRNMKIHAVGARNYSIGSIWNKSIFARSTSPALTSVWNRQPAMSASYTTQNDQNEVGLVEFLDQEISTEQEIRKSRCIPSKIDDFEVKLDGAEVSLIKTTPNETIEVHFTINNSMESNELENEAYSGEETEPQLSSRPEFEVNIKKGDVTLGFTCAFTDESNSNEEIEDTFSIEEMTVYKGEFSSKVYTVSAQILDGLLYDLLINLLDEKGITNGFVVKLSELSTAYEHSMYITLLRELRKFAS